MILLHGRGGNAEDILSLAQFFSWGALSNIPEALESASPQSDGTEATAFLAPQATNDSWYPYSFLAPTSANEPALSSALGVVATLVAAADRAGIPRERVYLLGFSQGACLALEFAARNATRYGGLFAFSGGLIGESLEKERYQGAFAETPVFMGCSDTDPHIPKARFLETAAFLRERDAIVTDKLYPQMPHMIIADEIHRAQSLFFLSVQRDSSL
jgi:phospholipase/carboxylesterase